MTRFWREGHYRRGPYGGLHWVEGHWVDRGDWWSTWAYTSVPTPAPVAPGRSGTWIDPNAHCPVCGAEVFFYSNEFGSRVYFDDLGPPWPKHPCTDDVPERRAGPPGAPTLDVVVLGIRDRVVLDPVCEFAHVPGVFMVTEVVKRGPKRVVTLQEVGGEQIEILLSPPAPPVHAIAVAVSWELHWFDPRTGTHGKNYVWRRSEAADS